MTAWFKPEIVTCEVGGRTMTIETGRMAKQAAGCALVTYGDTVVMVAVTRSAPRPGTDFFPLVVDFVEKTSAAGKIPGGFFKREGRLSEREILVSRFIDRAIRPLFQAPYMDETQVVALTLSADSENNADIPGFIGASAALMLSDLPFLGPIAAARVGRLNGNLVINPTYKELESSDFEFVLAGGREAVVMVEGEAKEVPEAEVLAALQFAHESLQTILDVQEELAKRAGKPTREIGEVKDLSELRTRVEGLVGDRFEQACRISDKQARNTALKDITQEIKQQVLGAFREEKVPLETLAQIEARQEAARELSADTSNVLHDIQSRIVRNMILEGKRIDGRANDEIRPIMAEVEVVPRAHGTALFTRGETQALCFATLGSREDEQMIDSLMGKSFKKFMLHYNFPPFCVGEARMMRGPGRREIGHGNLAERAIKAVLPEFEDFPYTIRVVSEVLESNGSSSMATVCAGVLALMDAGVKIKAPVAGIAMGLIEEGSQVVVLSDILGDEDHLGDMDFKVVGTERGITALQMDIKIPKVDWAVMEKAMAQAREGRLHILKRMAEETAEQLPGFSGRAELSEFAPRMEVIHIKPDRIRDLIGPGGKVIRAIQETTGVKINVDDSGEVVIFSPDNEKLEMARSMVEELTQEAEIGKLYLGKVKRIADFGAFVEIFPGTDGLVHISHLADVRIDKVTDVVSEGDEVLVKCIDIDPAGRIRLSRKEALAEAGAKGDA